MSTALTISGQRQLEMAYVGSFYFIAGCGGDIQEWIDGYEKLLEEEDIGKPIRWYQTTGATINRYAGDIPCPDRDYFQEDLTCLLFPLNDLNVGKLAMFKLRMEDRWFNDVINNMRRSF